MEGTNDHALKEQHCAVERNARAVALALWAQTHGFFVLATHVDFSGLAPDVPPKRVVRDVLKDSVKSLLQKPR